MKNKRSVAALAALFIVLLGCFFMPSYVSGIADRGTLDRLTVIDAKSISYEASTDLSIAERLRLIASPSREYITVKNGKTLTDHAARSLILSELARFFGTSESELPELTITACDAVFVINSDDPSINMIVWEFSLTGADGAIWKAVLDEETGMIIHIYYRVSELKPAAAPKTEASLEADAVRLRELIGAYFGMPAVHEYKLINGLGFYNVQLDFGGDNVVMYGIVRPTGFTFNE